MTAEQVLPVLSNKRKKSYLRRRFDALLYSSILLYYRSLLFLLSRFSIDSAVNLAVGLFSTPRRRSIRFNVKGSPPQKFLLDTPAGKVVVFRFLRAEPRRARVVVLHGWGGCSGQMQSLISRLVESGCEIITFDQPGHGESEGKLVSLPTFVLVLRRIVAELGPFDVAVGHSLGGAAAAYVLAHDSSVFSKIVLISAPADIVSTTRRFAALFRFDETLRELMQSRIEMRYNSSMSDFAAETYGSKIHSPVLVIHDHSDGETPYTDAERLSAEIATSKLIGTDGLGHNRILKDSVVLNHISEFVAETKH